MLSSPRQPSRSFAAWCDALDQSGATVVKWLKEAHRRADAPSTLLRRADTPMAREMPLMSDGASFLRSSSLIQDRMICAGKRWGGGPTTCPGDSGGPLVAQVGTKTYVLVGVTSAGKCATQVTVGIFAEVSSHRAWLIQEMNK
jgi:hypothetical protein